MGSSDSNVWHRVHAQREDGVAAMFLIRDVEPRPDQPKIFVIELPYQVTDLSGQPDAEAYRRRDAFEEQWLAPACAALDWTFVAWKSEDGAFFLYLYGAGDPHALLEQLAPFDGELGFFNDVDADWSEYATLRELVEQAEADDASEEDDAGDAGDAGEDDDGGNGHVHTDDCAHDHDGLHGLDAPANGIHVIDLTGEPAPPAWSSPEDAAPSGNGTPASAFAAPEAMEASSQPAPRKPRRAAANKPKRAATTAKRAAATAKRAAATAKRAAATAKRAAAAAKRDSTKKPSKRAATAGTATRRPASRRSPRR